MRFSQRFKRARLRYLSIVPLVLLLSLFCTPLYSEYSSSYDHYFERFGKSILPVYHWHWFKAQGIQESLLDPSAVSRAGARGIMQIMPGTWDEETRRLGIIASPHNPKANILVGISYMKRMVRFWRAPRSEGERLELAQASYNAGAGNILKAQVLCQNKSTWKEISPCLQRITGKRNSHETLGYVKRICRLYGNLKR